MKHIVAVTFTISFLLTLSGMAVASKLPSRQEKRALISAFRSFKHKPPGCTLENLRISTVKPEWAAGLGVCRGDNAYVLFRKRSSWEVSTYGTVDIGCGIAPWRVIQDLKLPASKQACEEISLGHEEEALQNQLRARAEAICAKEFEGGYLSETAETSVGTEWACRGQGSGEVVWISQERTER